MPVLNKSTIDKQLSFAAFARRGPRMSKVFAFFRYVSRVPFTSLEHVASLLGSASGPSTVVLLQAFAGTDCIRNGQLPQLVVVSDPDTGDCCVLRRPHLILDSVTTSPITSTNFSQSFALPSSAPTMIIRNWIPVSLLALLPQGFASQVHFQQHNVSTLSTNLIDVLSADEDYTSLLRLLQRARLIPTLSRLNGSTFFAPTNEAIKRHASSSDLWNAALSEDPFELRDNIQEKLREELFYHLLNYSIPDPLSDVPDSHHLQVHKTLHYPRIPVEPPSRQPPPYPPWLPMPGGSLGGQPQRLRLSPSSRDTPLYVGVDAFGKGGAQIIKQWVNASNGVILGIKDVLNVPPDIGLLFPRSLSSLWPH